MHKWNESAVDCRVEAERFIKTCVAVVNSTVPLEKRQQYVKNGLELDYSYTAFSATGGYGQ